MQLMKESPKRLIQNKLACQLSQVEVKSGVILFQT